MKWLQKAFGYTLMISVSYLVSTFVEFFIIDIKIPFFVFLMLISLIIFKISSNPDHPHYPFAFQVDLRSYLH